MKFVESICPSRAVAMRVAAPLVVLLALSVLLTACALPAPSASDGSVVPIRVKLIALNDFHGNLEPPTGRVTAADPDQPGNVLTVPAGGAAYLAGLVARLKSVNPNNLVVGAGDLVGASPITSSAFHDEPTIDLLNRIGLRVTSVGNHEFDRGRDELLRLQNGGCRPRSADGRRGVIGRDTCLNDGRFDGAAFQYLAANVIDQTTGQPLLPAYRIERVGSVSIAFIGLTLRQTASVVTPAGVAGLRFEDEVRTVNALIPEIKARGVDAIVVLIHQGGYSRSRLANDDRCPGFQGDILAIADAFDPAVSVVISGHTHRAYVCTRPDGRLITQAGSYGQLVTDIDLEFDPRDRRLMRRHAINHVVLQTETLKDPAIDALVRQQADRIAPIREVVEGAITSALSRMPNAAGESTLGDLVADAHLAATADPSFGPAQIAFTNPGGLRQDLPFDATTGGRVNYGMLYAVTPFVNTLTTMDLTGTQLKRLLEQQWELPQRPGGRILQVSDGFRYAWDAGKPEQAQPRQGDRVIAGSMSLRGAPIEPDTVYRVTVNSFLASGGDDFSVFTAGTRVQTGPIDIDALTTYLRAHSPYTPARRQRIERR